VAWSKADTIAPLPNNVHRLTEQACHCQLAFQFNWMALAAAGHWVILLFGLVFRWDQMAQCWSQSDVEFNKLQPGIIADVIGDSSLVLPYFFVYFWISEKWSVFAHQNLISNWLTYAKSTGELISFEFSDRSVRSLVSAKCSANRWVQTKKT